MPFSQKEQFINFQKEMNAANWPQEDYNPYPFRISHPWQYSMDRSYAVVKGNYIKHKAPTIEECITWIKENAGGAKKAAKLQCAIWRNRSTDIYYITPKNKGGIVLKEFITKEEAFDFYKNNHDELVAIYSKLRDIPEERRKWNRPRLGSDYRNDINVTPEQFSATFPFRGGRVRQLGNSVRESRQPKRGL